MDVLVLSPVMYFMVLRLFQIEDIRGSIDKIDENVAEVKKLFSVILSAPTSDQSKTSAFFAFFWSKFCFKWWKTEENLTFLGLFSKVLNIWIHFAGCEYTLRGKSFRLALINWIDYPSFSCLRQQSWRLSDRKCWSGALFSSLFFFSLFTN